MRLWKKIFLTAIVIEIITLTIGMPFYLYGVTETFWDDRGGIVTYIVYPYRGDALFVITLVSFFNIWLCVASIILTIKED